MKYDFYVLCNFSYCLHHSFLTGLLGIVSGSCGRPEIRTVLMPPSQALSLFSPEKLLKFHKKTDVQYVCVDCGCGFLDLAALTMSAGDRFTLLQTSLEIRYGHREKPRLLNTILSQNNTTARASLLVSFSCLLECRRDLSENH